MFPLATDMSFFFDPSVPLAPAAQDWDEDKTPFRRNLVLAASTYQAERLFDIPPTPTDWSTEHYLISPRQSFGYQNRILPKGKPLRINGATQEGQVSWTGDVVIPMLIDLKRWARNGEPFSKDIPENVRVRWGAAWMSLTPMEMLSQRSGVQAATGTVVVGGLGLGWLLKKVCQKSTVDRVVVVEKSQELLEWYGYDLCRRYSKVSDVICDDIYNQVDKHGDQARFLLDIWPTFQGTGKDKRLREARRKLRKRLWAWGNR